MASRFWVFITSILALILFGVIILQMLNETGGSNSYALLAESFLKGEFNTLRECFDVDCVYLQGRTFVIFPPFPAVLTMPFVAIFGVQFSGFIAISIIIFLATGLVWWKIIRKLGKDKSIAFLFVIAILFSSPLLYVIIRGDRVWFFAQSISFFSLSLALYYVLNKRDSYRAAIFAGILVGCSFLSRQMTILIAPFIFAILIEDGLPLFTINRDRLLKFISMAIPIALAISIYFIYNYWRFGNIMDTGYQYLEPTEVSATGNFIYNRLLDLGIFNADYFLFNIIHLLFQGLDIEFAGKYLNDIGSLDSKGAALLVASPFLFFLALTPIAKKSQTSENTIFSPRVIIIGVIVSLIIIGITLFYHSNGTIQYNVQRYTLDWLPVAFIILATALRKDMLPLFAALVSFGIMLNIVSLAILSITT